MFASFWFLQPGEQGAQGTYKIYATWQDDYPTGPDKRQGRYNEKNSKIVRDLPPPEGTALDIDHGKAGA